MRMTEIKFRQEIIEENLPQIGKFSMFEDQKKDGHP